MADEPSGQALAEYTATASLRVLESAVALARAEAKLVLVRARALFVGALIAALGALMAVAFATLTLVLVALGPLVLAPRSTEPTPLLIALGIAVGFSLIGALGAWIGWRRFGRRALNDDQTGAEP
jgi:hypothetical protein